MDPTLEQSLALLVQLAMGISLAACAGLRAFLPMLLVGLAGRMDILPLSGSFEWMASTPALTVFGAAVVTEFLGDKVPVVDHGLDLLALWVKPIAGTILVASVLTDLSPLQSMVLGIVTGGTAAGTVHLGKAKLRLISTASSAGLGNPLISTVEDAGALAGSVTAILLPLLAFLGLVAAVLVLAWLGVRARRAVAGAART